MQISVSDAKGQLTELVRRAEAGDEVILTRHGHAAVRLVPVTTVPNKESRRALLEAVRASAKAIAGRALRAAKTSSMAMVVCQNDRCRYIRINGDRFE